MRLATKKLTKRGEKMVHLEEIEKSNVIASDDDEDGGDECTTIKPTNNSETSRKEITQPTVAAEQHRKHQFVDSSARTYRNCRASVCKHSIKY